MKRKRIESPNGHTESENKSAIRRWLGQQPDVRVFPNAVGVTPPDPDDPTAPRIRYGLATGSADLVAIVAPHGRWLSIEVKADEFTTDPKRRQQQDDWATMIETFGGVAGREVQTIEQAAELLEQARLRP